MIVQYIKTAELSQTSHTADFDKREGVAEFGHKLCLCTFCRLMPNPCRDVAMLRLYIRIATSLHTCKL